MNKKIVITSIFKPTEAVRRFAELDEYQLIVVGDKKTPVGWSCENTTYLSVDDQLDFGYKLAEVLPYNHYCRKMLGYLTAIRQGAEVIVDTDDDNIPKHDWEFPLFQGKYDTIKGDMGFVNIYHLFTDQHIWPRGLPLGLINKSYDFRNLLKVQDVKVGIWQGLADEDPDVDAIYRLTSDKPCFFKKRGPVVLERGTLCPFNTQNTMIRKELFPLMYLPTYVTFRFTDILRGLVAQPIFWLYGYRLGFTEATVVQKRNPHDYMKDFISEIPMYEHTHRVIELVDGSISASESITTNLHKAYKSLLDEQIISPEEMITLEAWIEDLS